MKVQNMTSSRGNRVANQFIIADEGVAVFQSYNTIICKIDYENDQTYLDKDWNYSKTTQKYLNIFLDSNKKEIEKNIKDGKYQVVNLN